MGRAGISGPWSQFQSTHPRGCDATMDKLIRAKVKVSIHAPARVRPPTLSTPTAPTTFQSMHPRGCDRSRPRYRTGWPPVSIHAPARVRLWADIAALLKQRFQSTHPRGCDAPKALTPRHCTSFNPRTCEGATRPVRNQWAVEPVSIHAPARVRREGHQVHADLLEVSIHAPARVRPALIRGAAFMSHVSIHAPVRVRRAAARRCAAFMHVSIHAPARVRRGSCPVWSVPATFQSTHPRGCDGTCPARDVSPVSFQSTHPRGCDNASRTR